MNDSLEHAKEVLREKFPNPVAIQFMGISVNDFEKEDLVRIITWSQVDCERIRSDMFQSNRIHRELRRAI